MSANVQGVFAALFTPRASDGSVDLHVLRSHAEHLFSFGVQGVVINGATGEYLFSREGDFEQVVGVVRDVAGPGRFIAGIGATDLQRTIDYGRLAHEAGALALLLPGPHFFSYQQQDLRAYVRHVASSVAAPILLYNLPQFANGYETATVVDLIEGADNIIGIKDSSGSLEILRALSQRPTGSVSRVVGNDSALVAAQQEGVADAVISGVAAALPELIQFLFHNSQSKNPNQYSEAADLLSLVIDELNRFPVPWGLKFLAQHRGMGNMGSPLPLSSARSDQAIELERWLQQWWSRAGKVIPLQKLRVESAPLCR
jgi:4-hydroxy-tetrahydrodipicolinate synthase